MATLQEVKRRRTSVLKTRKITKAMQLVATAKIRRAKQNLDLIQEYYHAVYDTFQDLLINVEDISNMLPKSQKSAKAIIVVTSDLGLCGAYNTNILRELRELYRPGDYVFMIGNKGINHCRANKIPVFKQYPNIGDKIDYLIPNSISMRAINLFMSGEINEVSLLYTSFVNSVTFTTSFKKLLPVEKVEKYFNTIETRLRAMVDVEPNPQVVLKTSLPLYISAVIYGTTIESKLSEMSARRSAMENATDNADELVEKLNLLYNRARQAKITQEITEIVAGAESI